MRSPRRWALALGAAAIAAAVGLALGWWRSSPAQPAPGRPIAASASLSAETVAFADGLTARADVLVDPRRVDPASVRLRPRFGPFRIVSTSIRTRTAGGVLRSYRFELECLEAACVPGRTQAERRFLPALLSFRTAAGRTERLTLDWPAYRVVSHLTTPDIGDPTRRLRAATALPLVTYRVSPAALQALLAAGAGLLALAAAALVALALPARGSRPAAGLPPLERALLLVRTSTANGYPARRRQALGRLARELRAAGRGDLAADAVRLAWSAEPPSAEASRELADRVEASL